MNRHDAKTNLHGDFWSMSYRGHEIAIHRHSSGWLVYLNKAMLNGMRFAEARCAANWLRRKVDEMAAGAA